MEAYITPIKIALLTFPFIAFLLSLPFLIHQYHKYGGFTFWRAFIIFSFIFYLMCAYFLVILPLPSQSEVNELTTRRVQIIPFQFVIDFVRETVFSFSHPRTYIEALKQGVLIQPLFNLLLLLPLGVYLRFYFKRSFKFVILAGFFTALFFELTQLSGLYGIYSRSYRLFDVDDLMLNTAGALLGFAIAPAITFFIPDEERLINTAYSRSHRVSYLRRFIAFMIDWTIIAIIAVFVTIGGEAIFVSNVIYEFSILNILRYLMTIIVFFVIIPYLTKGRTLGKAIVHLKIVNDLDQPPSPNLYMVRYGILYGLIFTNINLTVTMLDLTGTSNHLNLLNYLIIISFFFTLVFAIHLLMSKLRKNEPLFYEKISYTHMMSSFSLFKKKR